MAARGSIRSRWVPVPFSLLQGSVLGLLLFADLELLHEAGAALSQSYADYLQLQR